ncbi:MAG: nucleoside kinase [Treponema sp.]|jgi:uridine kinase|nr:nucleoside kinase [Treponema sp.]
MNDILIRFTEGDPVTCQAGIRADSFAGRLGAGEHQIAAVRINNEILPLSATIEVNAEVEPVLLEAPEGVMIYRRSLAFILAIAARELFPERSLYVGHSLGNSYYYTFMTGKKPSEKDMADLGDRMLSIVKENRPIEYRRIAYGDALELFEKNNQADTRVLLDQRSDPVVKVNVCGTYADLYIEPLVPRTGFLDAFDLMPYGEGFLLRFPAVGRNGVIDPFEDNPGIFTVYDEYKKWGRIVGVHAVGSLNRLVAERTIRDYIRMAEAFQARKIADAAEKIWKKRDTARVVLIAGPSSSGKTTSAKRLSIELMVTGIRPIAISLDDYYVGLEKTPRDENGEPDFECLEALDIPFLNEQILALLDGKEVTLPVYDFKTGRRRESGGKKISLDRRSMLIVEGIHGLNDALTPQIARETKFKLYVSALTQLNLDDHNRIPTSDNRLLRRMVRDYQFRGKDAAGTIRMWPSVQAGERKHIFPFQNGADMAFNSALDYELSVLKYYADPLLRAVKPKEREYAEAVRLLSFLENFAPIPPQYVPGTSILREFIGESEFKY